MNDTNLIEQTLSALAFAGDLSMGQPPEHSPAVACLAAKIARASGASEETIAYTAQLALIRWAGCTANAQEFAELLGDDVRGRAELLAGRNPFVAAEPPVGSIHSAIEPLALAHCEIAALLCDRLNLNRTVSEAVLDIFETWDGGGLPNGKSGEDIAEIAQYVSLAGDAEVFSRIYGVTRAAVLISSHANKKYEATLASRMALVLPSWLDELKQAPLAKLAIDEANLKNLSDINIHEAANILGDYADLKIPGHSGHSRLAGKLAQAASKEMKLSVKQTDNVIIASTLASIGRVAISNSALGLDSETISEAERLAPHWTKRILNRMSIFAAPAELAGLAYERLDGSGLEQNVSGVAFTKEARLVQTVRATVEAPQVVVSGVISSKRARNFLEGEVSRGRLDNTCVSAVLKAIGVRKKIPQVSDTGIALTPREADVLLQLTQGLSNKEIARILNISPKTVSSHLEKIFCKLGVKTRAAATLKALETGLI